MDEPQGPGLAVPSGNCLREVEVPRVFPVADCMELVVILTRCSTWS